MAQTRIEFDSSGMDRMLLELEKRTGATFEKVVRGVTAAVVTGAATKTKQGKPADVIKAINKVKRRGFITKSGAQITVTSANKVWYRGAGWKRNQYVLLNMNGKIENIGSTAFRTGKKRAGAINISAKAQAQINRDLGELRAWAIEQANYIKSQLGSGRASFLEMLKQLGLKPTTTRGLGRAMKVKLPPTHRAAISTKVMRGKREEFQIQVASRSTAALNPRAGGIRAFSLSLRGQVKGFEKAAQTDITEYAKKFATRTGITVKG